MSFSNMQNDMNLPPFALFLMIGLTATLLRLFVVEGPQHRSYEASTIVLFACTLVLA